MTCLTKATAGIYRLCYSPDKRMAHPTHGSPSRVVSPHGPVSLANGQREC